MARPLGITRGRQFECTQCGNCCVRDGLVYMSATEEQKIAAHLSLSLDGFRKRFEARRQPEGMMALEAKDGRGCPLLTSDRRCSVHPVKPSQCKTWPFWPEMIDDGSVWQASKTFCPGLDAPTGKRYSRLEILAISDEQRGTD